MKLTVLWSRLAGYSVAFFRELARQGCRIQLFYVAAEGELAFDPFDLSFCREAHERSYPLPDDFFPAVERFKPDAVLMSGWSHQPYMRVARALRAQGTPVVSAVDNPWYGTLRQRLGTLLAPVVLRPAISALFVCGERQADFARRLRLPHFEGLYAADVSLFAGLKPLEQRPPNFLFAGRLIGRKGVPALLDAYARYRSSVRSPMGLRMAGRGPLEGLCRAAPGVEVVPFVQPAALPAYFEQGQCLVLPSIEDHWGVVLHEGAAAGLALIATEVCGATPAFVHEGQSGFRVQTGADDLLRALRAFDALDLARRAQMSRESLRLAQMRTPAGTAADFIAQVRALRR